MTPPARVQAAIEILDGVLTSVRSHGPAADTILANYFRTRRYAGSKDRTAVRALVFAALRSSAAEDAFDGRLLMACQKDAAAFFGYEDRNAPPALTDHERERIAAIPAHHVSWLADLISPELMHALLQRAPLDVRVNSLKATREQVMHELAGQNIAAEPTPFAPLGIRLPSGTALQNTDMFKRGLIEIQDEASQLVALATGAKPGDRVIDLCAGAGGKTLALAAMMQNCGTLIAADIDMARLDRMKQRIARAGATIISYQHADALNETADIVLVDAPCTGSGTWRRNPEARLRLKPDMLANVTKTQRHVLDRAVKLIRPGGRIVYAVCSILPAEGSEQISAALTRHNNLTLYPVLPNIFPTSPIGLSLRPDQHGCDGFFIACLQLA